MLWKTDLSFGPPVLTKRLPCDFSDERDARPQTVKICHRPVRASLSLPLHPSGPAAKASRMGGFGDRVGAVSGLAASRMQDQDRFVAGSLVRFLLKRKSRAGKFPRGGKFISRRALH
jgi:hypothetical protein